MPGDEFLVMESERDAKVLSEERLRTRRAMNKLAAPQRADAGKHFRHAGGRAAPVLKIVLKCDVQGSLEALLQSLGKIESKKIDLDIIHAAVGPVTESDILLASASNAVVIGFNVKVESSAAAAAKREGVQIKLFSIIYELIDQVKEAMAGMLDPEVREAVIGHAEVKQVFDLSRGKVAGCLVTDGRIARTARARVLRGKQPIYDGGFATLRRFTGRREGSPQRAGVRHQAGRFQRIRSRRHHRVLQPRKVPAEAVTGAAVPGCNSARMPRAPGRFSLRACHRRLPPMKHRLERVNEIIKRELSEIVPARVRLHGAAGHGAERGRHAGPEELPRLHQRHRHAGAGEGGDRQAARQAGLPPAAALQAGRPEIHAAPAFPAG